MPLMSKVPGPLVVRALPLVMLPPVAELQGAGGDGRQAGVGVAAAEDHGAAAGFGQAAGRRR